MKIDVSKLFGIALFRASGVRSMRGRFFGVEQTAAFGIHAGMHCGFRFGNQNGRGIRN